MVRRIVCHNPSMMTGPGTNTYLVGIDEIAVIDPGPDDAAAAGYGIEVGTHAVRLMIGGVFDQFPNLKIVLGHMGEAIPFWLWRLDYMGGPDRDRGPNKRYPSEYFEDNFAITTSGVEDPLALRYCIDKIGADHVMWAIDYPYQPTTPAVTWIDQAELTEEERDLICHGNAERIFHIQA
jgi:2,3-dihydroxybenzoate decarboxylase/5-carboxyvanillate decarboxylase